MSMTTLAPALVAAFMLVLGAGCERDHPAPTTPAPEATTQRPQRIVSLAPALTEMLFAVGAGPQVVGVTAFCNHPPAATSRTSVGKALPKTINIERIVALEPDLVLSSGDGQEPVVDELRGMGLRAEYVRVMGLEEALAGVVRLGDLVGRPEPAVAERRRMEAEMAAIEEAVAAVTGGTPPRVFYEVWSDPLITAGPDTYLIELVERAGGRSIFPDLGNDYPQISAEEVVRRNPEVILGPAHARSRVTLATVRQRPGWEGIAAVRAGRVYSLPDDIVHRPGPRIPQALALIASRLYPGLATRPAVASRLAEAAAAGAPLPAAP